ncbi:hypothetical protein KQI41_10750 [Tissierella pigra]|uniref:Resolvase/invertase-type recombinase catalytic domain-containing protein n=1 Tax=Tissierella pigra TaxID=2607614 RepID=A0A6N7XRL2_9FIRM|nr:hypothetical protein [Tissierella pigra]MBU5426889.1 hypothetical protein [Tissierella pigra]MSU03482.1 hypothetical protein [Tissierella pigra]
MKNNYKNIDKENRTPKVAIYIRVGGMEQLSDEARQRLLNAKLENFKKEICNVDSSYKKERGVGYTTLSKI